MGSRRLLTKRASKRGNISAATACTGSPGLRVVRRQGTCCSRGIGGIGLGAAGIGLPDIPIFTAVLLKGVYEVALHYGYEYDSEKEKYFVLRIIEVALLYGADLDRENEEMNRWIEE
ncbi:MAG: EcsC family protein, partial [Firmicutes bacterium]|nr:EcsC family protein [Bacillota bacterium]